MDKPFEVKEFDTIICNEDYNVAKNIFKGNVEDVIDLPEKKYSINSKAFENINSYKEIL
ncbi:MAG: hypothetical protein ACLRZD_00675 [Lachnospira sp.]